MSWPLSLLVSFLAAALGVLASGVVALLAVDWYRVSSFEGGSAYMVVGLGLLGGVAGFLLGLVVSRVVAGRPKPGFLKALAYSGGLVLGIAAVAGGAARLLADVPPAIDGETLLLAVEIRFPAGHPGPSAGETRDWALRLGSSSGGTLRVSKLGPIWKADARLVDGRWVVPGAVELFTSRGSRVLDILPEGVADHGFLVPLPAYPGTSYLEWSEWLPKAGPGGQAPPEGLSYRFKVVPRNQPVRTETVGPFDVATIARSFTYFGERPDGSPYQADAEFLVRYRGQPVTIEHRPEGPSAPVAARFDRASAVAVVPGAGNPALLVHVMAGYNDGYYYLLTGDGGPLRAEYVSSGPPSFEAFRLTSDAEVFARARDVRPLAGHVDRGLFAGGGLFLVGSAVLDATRGTVRRFAAEPAGPVRMDLPPVDVSPDERSVVRVGFDAQAPETRVLHVTDTVAGRAYAVPIDMAGMRLAFLETIDPAWVAHYFAWARGADGVDRLVARAGVTPLPYRGTLTVDRDGYREYRVPLAGAPVAEALAEFLASTFGAEREPGTDTSARYDVRIGGRAVHVMVVESPAAVAVWMDRGTDTALVADIAKRFDAALATGTYDGRFSR